MPSKSDSQARLMAAIAHSKEFRAKLKSQGKDIPSTSVAKEFNQSDKGTERLRQAMTNRSRK